MRTHLLFTLFFLIGIAFNVHAQEKQMLTHADYSYWKSIKDYHISNNGKYISYTIEPQEGDGHLYINKLYKGSKDSISRGHNSKFLPNSNFLIFKIKPQFDTLRAAKLKKVKKDDLPKDSVCIWDLSTGESTKFARLKSFKTAKEDSDFIALLLEYKKENDTVEKQDTTKQDKKDNGDNLIIINPATDFSINFKQVKDYAISENGKTIAFIQIRKDSIDSVFVKTFNTHQLTTSLVFSSEGCSENIAVDVSGEQIAFTFSSDTIEKNKTYGLYYQGANNKGLINISGDSLNNLPQGMSISTHGKIFFNKSGSELYFGLRNKPEPKVKDTLTDDEKVSVDIWNWKDPLLQTQQIKELEDEKKRSYVTVYFPISNKIVSLADSNLRNVIINKKTNSNLSLAYDHQKYQRETSWDGNWYNDYYLINRENGEHMLILEKTASAISFSPQQNFVAWYNIADSSWNIYDIKKEKSRNISSLLDINFYNELNDIPNEAPPYGKAHWTEKEQLVVYDKYDLWMFDPQGKRNPVNITNGFGRNNNIKFRYVKLDPEEKFIPKNIMLTAFDYKSKKSGFHFLENKKEPQQLIWEDMIFTSPKKAKNADIIVWRKQSFVDYPELFVSTTTFGNTHKITLTNPQQKDFNWGTSELVSWKTYDGEDMQGIFYKPENFDSSRKYPMLVYFYERYSDRLHRHSVPAPIRSVINFTYYTSNEYLIFVPDIDYKKGYPGPSAYNCIISGTEAMMDQFDFIDSKNIGMQGQSWGGYQVAYLITKTNIFKAAMAGAPVSNMTSAYGGIRWQSGRSRAFQYEETQSRIGGTLWEKQDLYILNSPLFFVPKINTPLLIMHNDKDGAVPWYQGIEMFSAMRRLNKPVWMLVYNNAPHNLKRRADMKDLTIRMQQFFDFYLKDAPEPKWMKTGVPALKKGKEFGFEE